MSKKKDHIYIGTLIPKSEHEALKSIAKKDDRKIAAFLRALVREAIRESEKETVAA